MAVATSRLFTGGSRPCALARFAHRSQRAALVGVLAVAAASALAACGGASGGSPGVVALAGNSGAEAGNGAAAATGQADGSAVVAGSASTNGGSVPAASASAPTASANVPTPSAGVPVAGATPAPSGGSAPTTAAAPSASGSDLAGSPATLPAGVQGLSCPLPGPPSGRVNSVGWGQAIPAGFQPVAAVQCVPNGSTPAPSGQSPFVREEVAVSGLGPLLAALLEPSETPGDSSPVPRCLAPAADVFQLALIGADGQVIEPLIPVTLCGGPIQPVVASIAALDWTTVN